MAPAEVRRRWGCGKGDPGSSFHSVVRKSCTPDCNPYYFKESLQFSEAKPDRPPHTYRRKQKTLLFTPYPLINPSALSFPSYSCFLQPG